MYIIDLNVSHHFNLVKDQFFAKNPILYNGKSFFQIQDSYLNPICTNLTENGKIFGFVRTQILRIRATTTTHSRGRCWHSIFNANKMVE
jgi:hypothetical protein